MEQEKINSNNKLIAEFMGAKLIEYNLGLPELYFDNYPDNRFIHQSPIQQLKYHSSWDWLMPVVEKIQKELPYYMEGTIAEYNKDSWGLYSSFTGDTWTNYYWHDTERLSKEHSKQKAKYERYGDKYVESHRIIVGSKIEAVFMCVVDFIEYHNKLKK